MQLPPNQCPQVWNSIAQHKTGGSTHLHFAGAQQKHKILSEISTPARRNTEKKKKEAMLFVEPEQEGGGWNEKCKDVWLDDQKPLCGGYSVWHVISFTLMPLRVEGKMLST